MAHTFGRFTSGGSYGSAGRGTAAAGGPVDFVNPADDPATSSGPYRPGVPFLMTCGGSFSAGADLASDGSGRAVAAGTGDRVVARALEGSTGAGDTAWCAYQGGWIK